MTLKPATWMCSIHRFIVMTAPLQRCACCLSERCSTAPTEPLFTRDDLVKVAEQVREALVDTEDWIGIPKRIVAEMLGKVDREPDDPPAVIMPACENDE